MQNLVHRFVYVLCLQPKVVTALDEAELARQMERAEAENAEVAGDSDQEEDEGMGGVVGEGEGEGEGDNDAAQTNGDAASDED